MYRKRELERSPRHIAAINTASMGILCILFLLAFGAPGIGQEVLPRFTRIQKAVEAEFQEKKDFDKKDLIARDDVETLFVSFSKLGWNVGDQKEILEQMLDARSPLVRTLQSRNGRKFMRKVSGYKLIYDRLDRISREAGGQQLLVDLVKLPDGYRYAEMKTARGVPNMLDFLPKTRSGKRRTIKNYEKPTGRIYTLNAFIQRLRKSHAEAVKKPKKQRDGR